MLLDKRSTFARELPVAGAAGTAKFGAAIPLDVAADQGSGEPLFLVISVPVAWAGGTSIAFEVVVADDDALTSNVTVLFTTAAFPVAAAVAGATLLAVPLPSGNYKKFMGLRAVKVGTFTAGLVNAFLTLEFPNYRAYPDAAW